MLKQAKIYVSNYEETINFYRNLLPKSTDEISNSQFELNFKQNKLVLEKNQTDEYPYYHFAFLIPYENFDEAKDYVSSKVALNKENGNDENSFADGLRSIFFYDPSGNVVEFMAARNSELQPYESFSEDSIECLTEMSLVSDDTEKTVKELKQAGLTESIGSLGSRDLIFLFSGDAALLISPTERNWYFSDKNAQVFPQEIDIEDVKIIVNDDKEIIIESLSV